MPLPPSPSRPPTPTDPLNTILESLSLAPMADDEKSDDYSPRYHPPFRCVYYENGWKMQMGDGQVQLCPDPQQHEGICPLPLEHGFPADTITTCPPYEHVHAAILIPNKQIDAMVQRRAANDARLAITSSEIPGDATIPDVPEFKGNNALYLDLPTVPGKPNHKPRPVTLGYNVSKAKLLLFEKYYPGIKFTCIGGSSHPHPLLAYERQVGEQRAVEYLRGSPRIVDIGGNAERHFNAGRNNVWNCCPILSPEDVNRNSRYVGLRNFCQHKFEDCDCVYPDSYLSIHSIYYLTPELVCAAVNSCKSNRLVSLHHTFDQAYGVMASGEAQYMVDARGNVQMHAIGNVTDYFHSACAWLRSGYFEDHTTSTAMSWSIVHLMPNSHVVLFLKAPYGMPKPAVGYTGLVAAIHDPEYYGPIQLHGNAFHNSLQQTALPMFVNQVVNLNEFYSWGTTIISFDAGSSTTIQIPKHFVDELAAYIAGKPRDPTTFNNLLAQARVKAKDYSIPPAMLPMTIVAGASLAFVKYVRMETRVTAHAFMGNSSLFTILNQLLKFDFPYSVQFRYIIILVMLVTTIFIAMGKRRHRAVASTVLALVAIYNAIRLKTASVYKPVEMFNNGIREYHATGLSFSMPNYGMVHLPGLVRLLGRVVNKPVPTTISSANVGRPVIRDTSDRPNKETVALVGCGIIVPESLPTAFASDPINERAALVNRALLVKQEIDESYYLNTFMPFVHKHFMLIFPHIPEVRENFDEWNARFPAPQRIRHAKLRAQRGDYMDDPKRDKRIKAFGKIEKLLLSSQFEVKDADPRMISGGTDEFNIAVGPWIHAFSKMLAKLWNLKHFIHYASGSTPEKLGQWFDRVGHRSAKHKYGTNDFSRYDVSQQRLRLLFMIYVFWRFGAPDYVLYALIWDIHKSGATAHGIMFAIDGTMASGRPITSVGNSLTNGVDAFFNICQNNPDLEPFVVAANILLAVLGDDSNFIIPLSYNPPTAEIYAKLGCISELQPVKDSYNLEFCSSLWWPTTDGVVLGPKPGRFISKLGWLVKPNSVNINATQRSMLTAFNRDANFIPPIAAIVRVQLGLTRIDPHRPAKINFEHGVPHATAMHAPSVQTWEMLYSRYEWTPSDQSRLVQLLSTVRALPAVITGDYLLRFLRVDNEMPGAHNLAYLGIDHIILALVSSTFFRMHFDMATAAFIEEPFKRLRLPIGGRTYRVGMLMPWIEVIYYYFKLKDQATLPVIALCRIPPLILHHYWAALPLKWGILSHLLYNAASYTVAYVYQPP